MYIIRIKGSSCYTLAQIFPEFLACEQALYLGYIVKRRRAGDTREERAGRRGFAARSGVLASLASLAQLWGLARRLLGLAQVVQKLDSAIHRINHYPADTYYGKQLRYPLDSD